MTAGVRRQIKRRRPTASALSREAVRAEVRRRELLAETERYLAAIVAEVGEPTPEDRAWARRTLGVWRRR